MNNLHTYIPRSPLSDYIHQFWLIEDYLPLHSQERILPFGAMELLIVLSDNALRLLYPDNGDKYQYFRRSLVAGARSEHFIVDTAEATTILGVYFKPAASSPFFGIPANKLQNLHVPLDVLWGMTAADVRDQLLERPTPADKFQLLEMILLNQLARSEARHPAVAYALSAFNRIPQEQTILQITEQISMSPRRFIQVFNDEVGLTPKLYCRVVRFHRALNLITQRRSGEWSDIALLCGYYDQSHFINEFKDFTGIRPTQYYPQSPEHLTNVPVESQSEP